MSSMMPIASVPPLAACSRVRVSVRRNQTLPMVSVASRVPVQPGQAVIEGTGCHASASGFFHGSCPPLPLRHQSSHNGANAVTARSGSASYALSSAIWSAP
jgi:hypothetical protein